MLIIHIHTDTNIHVRTQSLEKRSYNQPKEPSVMRDTRL